MLAPEAPLSQQNIPHIGRSGALERFDMTMLFINFLFLIDAQD